MRAGSWLISLAYWIHCAPGLGGSQRARLAGVAVSAPALWATTDLILAGNPLYSLTYTRWATEVAWRPTGIATVPRVLYTTLTAYFGAPLLLGAGAGLVLDLRHRCLPRAIPALLALSLVSFVAVGAAGLPVINRYALPITVLITLYFGFFLEGWRRVRSLGLRRAWAAAACALVVLTVAGAPAGIGALLNQRTTLNQLGRMTAHLGTLLQGQATRAAISGCGPLQTSYQVVPLLAYDLGRNPRDVVVVNTGIPVRGSVVEPARAQHLFAATSYAVSAYTQRGFRLVAADAEWVVFTRCPTSVVGG